MRIIPEGDVRGGTERNPLGLSDPTDYQPTPAVDGPSGADRARRERLPWPGKYGSIGPTERTVRLAAAFLGVSLDRACEIVRAARGRRDYERQSTILGIDRWLRLKDRVHDGSDHPVSLHLIAGGTMGRVYKQPLLSRGQILDAEAQMLTSLEALTPPRLTPDEWTQVARCCASKKWNGSLLEGWYAAEVEP